MGSVESLIDLLPSFEGKDVVIIGPPASGKSSLSSALANVYTQHNCLHSDDYMERYEYKEALYALMEDMKSPGGPSIIEGMQGYRLLRKGIQERSYYPDFVIELRIQRFTMEARYEMFRKGKDIGKAISWAKMHDDILKEYEGMYNPKPPVWIRLHND